MMELGGEMGNVGVCACCFLVSADGLSVPSIFRCLLIEI